jgi:hypothetical protein
MEFAAQHRSRYNRFGPSGGISPPLGPSQTTLENPYTGQKEETLPAVYRTQLRCVAPLLKPDTRRVNVDTGRYLHFVANRDEIRVVKQIVVINESSIAGGVEAIRSTCGLTIPLPHEP